MSAKAFVHWLQENGFSPVCVLMWPCSSQGLEKDFPQKGHLQPWTGVWDRMCIARAAGELHSFMQWLHVCGASSCTCGELKLSIMRICGSNMCLFSGVRLIVRSSGSDWISLVGEGVRAGDLEVEEEEERLLGEDGLGETDDSLVAKPGL